MSSPFGCVASSTTTPARAGHRSQSCRPALSNQHRQRPLDCRCPEIYAWLGAPRARYSYFSDLEVRAARHDWFDRVQLDLPELEVDTSDDYRPGLDEMVAFANGNR